MEEVKKPDGRGKKSKGAIPKTRPTNEFLVNLLVECKGNYNEAYRRYVAEVDQVNLQTFLKWTQDPKFRQELYQAKHKAFSEAFDFVTFSAHEAAKTIYELMVNAQAERTRYEAACKLLQFSRDNKMEEMYVELQEVKKILGLHNTSGEGSDNGTEDGD